ncbi:bifunctional folylpolyglutamate synthase/dihydrofolate synthase [Succinimonas amylolytica]|uniref:bifunctional folylpolyglutamate synthase/dihydrofolate synthase n=1 Tax=Succinimonas amylolytica TaxID=83769 RepID=UPI0023A83FD0
MMSGTMPAPSIEAWQEYLGKVNPNVIKLGLERVRHVAAVLGVDTVGEDVRVVTVAGTNGKGSTAAMLAAILENAGYRTGLYTSPHIRTFNERIVYGGVMASDDDLIEAFEAVYTAMDDDHELTFFEFTTLAALYIFRNRLCNVLVLEVGLGGRLDAVNILDADIALIPSIGLDHCQILGSTLKEIAYEKAGIIKDHTVAVVTGELPEVCRNEIGSQAAQHEAALHIVGKNLKIRTVDATHFDFLAPIEILNLEVPALPLINAPLSVAAALLLRLVFKFGISDSDIRAGLRNATLHGRLEKISASPDVLIDVAHNPPAARYLAKYLNLNSRPRNAVIGMLKDKDIENTLREYTDLNLFEHYYVCSLPGERGAQGYLLEDKLMALGIPRYRIQTFDTAAQAYRAALAELPVDSELLVTGSFITVEEVLKSIDENQVWHAAGKQEVA